MKYSLFYFITSVLMVSSRRCKTMIEIVDNENYEIQTSTEDMDHGYDRRRDKMNRCADRPKDIIKRRDIGHWRQDLGVYQ